MTQYMRDRECLACHNKWSSLVVFSSHTRNLSGEVVEYCPKCRSRNVMSEPAYEHKIKPREAKRGK